MITKEQDEINKLVINYKIVESDIRNKCIAEIIKLIKKSTHTNDNLFNLVEHGINIKLMDDSKVIAVEHDKTICGELWVHTDCGAIADGDVEAMDYFNIFTEMNNCVNN